jgi:hypothetical protein
MRGQAHPRCVSKRPQKDELPKTSSLPVDNPEAQVELFRDVLQTVEKNRIPYAVSGAFALRHHTGIYRFTKDLDLFLTAETCEAALECLRETGAECTVHDPVWLSKASRDGFFVDLITGMSNGQIVVDDSWIERAHPAVVYGVNTRVLAAEELVASKLFVAKRERFDGADIAHIIYGTYGRFYWEREMELASEHWEMLLWALVLFRYAYPAQTHYVPKKIWRELLDRFEYEIREPDPQAEFRGSLVDDNMFAIDVNEWGLANLLERSRRERLSKSGESRARRTRLGVDLSRKAI